MLRDEGVNFLLYSYFGLELHDLTQRKEDEIITQCARRAYKDLCRTLRFSKAVDDGTHQDFCSRICGLLRQRMDGLLRSSADGFDAKHEEICREICTEAEEFCDEKKRYALDINPSGKGDAGRCGNVFYYGQAQKWLNMTIKYMWLLGPWEDQFEPLIPVIHVPVDSCIMKAASKKGVPIIRKGRKGSLSEYGPYDARLSLPWSQWAYENYIQFQEDLRGILTKPAPIVWEGPAWIEAAKS